MKQDQLLLVFFHASRRVEANPAKSCSDFKGSGCQGIAHRSLLRARRLHVDEINIPLGITNKTAHHRWAFLLVVSLVEKLEP